MVGKAPGSSIDFESGGGVVVVAPALLSSFPNSWRQVLELLLMLMLLLLLRVVYFDRIDISILVDMPFFRAKDDVGVLLIEKAFTYVLWISTDAAMTTAHLVLKTFLLLLLFIIVVVWYVCIGGRYMICLCNCAT